MVFATAEGEDAGNGRTGDPSSRTVSFAVESIDIGLDRSPHPFHLANVKAARQYWEVVSKANPALFDGTVMLHSTMERIGDRLKSVAHPVPFSTFLYWRDVGPEEGAWHLFGAPLLIGADDRVLLIRMGADTANAGKIYGPSGALDTADIDADRLDIEANMRREAMEETGLALDEAVAERGYRIFVTGRIVAIVRRYRFADDADALVARAKRHIAHQTSPEIADVFAVGPQSPADPDYQFFIPAVLDWHFADS